MIKTKRLVLNILTDRDVEAALDLVTNDIIKKTYMLPDFEKRTDALPLFQRLMTLSQDSSRFLRGIYLDGYLIGYINEVEKNNQFIELGYILHPNYHNQGYMTEALAATFTPLFKMGFKEVICGAFEGNKASLRVMAKAGMKLLERTDDIEYRGKVHRCIYYGIRNEE